MARKLKTFQTSLGFYDLAIAAPSMKAALEAWGAGSNLFHQGVAKETDDPDAVAATMSKPGVVLKRPAGSNGRFSEHSDLPSDLGSAAKEDRRESRRAGPAKRLRKRPPPEIRERDTRKAAAEFEKEQKRREAERRREEAARERERERREKATAKAQAALNKAEREHAKKAADIQAEVEALQKRSRAEDDRWEKERERLQAALRRARE
jgi:colicin import membrane protein